MALGRRQIGFEQCLEVRQFASQLVSRKERRLAGEEARIAQAVHLVQAALKRRANAGQGLNVHSTRLADAQEGLERRRREGLSFSYSTCMRTLVDTCVRLGDLELAWHYVEEWERAETEIAQRLRLVEAMSGRGDYGEEGR